MRPSFSNRVRLILLALTAATTVSGFRALPSLDARTLAGEYTLETINGRSLPGVQRAENPRTELTAAILTLASDGRWTQRFDGSIHYGANVQRVSNVEAGHFAIHYDRVELSHNSAEAPVFATLDGDRLTCVSDGVVLTYKKH